MRSPDLGGEEGGRAGEREAGLPMLLDSLNLPRLSGRVDCVASV